MANPRSFGRERWTISLSDGSAMSIWANTVAVDEDGRLLVSGGTRTNRRADAEDPLMAFEPGQWLSFFNTDDDGTPINAE